ncbi:MAG: DUF4910 domain-containing protein [Magnetococcus sp. MYC-9]
MAPRVHYSRQDALDALRNAGLSRGDTVFVTTGLGMLGIAEGVESAEALNRFFLESLQEVLGDRGTILVPTYSYTFGSSTLSDPACFDPATTPAAIGPFPEFFRQQPGVVRSCDPMVSVSGLGPACAVLFHALPPTSYGADSLFARLAQTDAKCCSIGLGPNWTPFIHHADWLRQVPFRYDKLFYGLLTTAEASVPTTWNYSVRTPGDASWANAHALGRMAVDAAIWRHAPLGRARVYVCGYREYFEFAVRAMQENPWLLASGPPCDVLLEERKRVGQACQEIDWPANASPAEMVASLAPLPRHPLSAAMRVALRALSSQIPLRIHDFPSGTHAFDWIIPECWTPRSATVTAPGGRVLLSTELGNVQPSFHSMPFSGQVSRERLLRNLHTAPALPDALPYRSIRGVRDWGLCCTENAKSLLVEDSYQVAIDTAYSYDHLPVGELTVTGSSSRTVLVCVFLEDAFQANAHLSGVVAGIELFRALLSQPAPRLTVRLLILPGPEGLAAWLARHEAEMSQVWGALVLCMLARSHPFLLDQSHLVGESDFAGCCHALLQEQGAVHTTTGRFDWLPSGGNRQGVPLKTRCRFPVVTIARTLPATDPGFPFHEFATDQDSVERCDWAALRDACQRVETLVMQLAHSSCSIRDLATSPGKR